MTCSASTAPAVDEGGETMISTVHPDVLLTHILTRLDGPTLASASCASSQIHTLTTKENLWRDICHVTWPSTDHPLMRQLISNFPNASRSFFSDAFPALVVSSSDDPPVENLNRISSASESPQQLISAVDLHYRSNLIFSKVQETETLSGWFRCSPFRVDLLEPKDVVPTPIPYIDETCGNLAEELTLSWIIVDPVANRAANLSSWRPVSVQRHWLSGEIQVSFATILAGYGGSTEFVKCEIMVALGGCEGEGGEMVMQVKEVSLKVEDMDGVNLNGKDSLGILQRAIESGRRKKGRRKESREKYEEYLKLKKERKERELRRERTLDTICIAIGVSIFFSFSIFVFVLFS